MKPAQKPQAAAQSPAAPQRGVERRRRNSAPASFRTFFERHVQPTQALVLSFGVVILVGTGLLMLPWASAGGPLGFVDALFTATSATCVTGLVVVDTGTALNPFGQGVILALIQLGGLGIMTYSSVFLLLASGRLSFRGRAIVHETLGRRQGQISVGRLVRDVFFYTLGIEVVGAVLLAVVFARTLPLPQALGQGLFHSISAFCNAGFALRGTSFMEYRGDALLNLTLIALIALGGLGFIVLEDLSDAWRDRLAKRRIRLMLHTKVVLGTTGLLTAVGTLAVWLFERENALVGIPWGETALACLFQSVTARTAGFNTLDYAALTNTTLFFTTLLMFVGASPGSCGGGIKTTTLAVVLALFRDRLLGRQRTRLFRRVLPEAVVVRSVALLIASFAFVTAVTLTLSVLETGPVPYRDGGNSFLGLLFETISAFGTVGLSTGVTPTLSTPGRLLIALTMFVGRLGPLTMAVAIRHANVREEFQYAEESLMVG